jgi:integrase
MHDQMHDQENGQDSPQTHAPWNKGRLTGQKRRFTLRRIWEIRIRLQIAGRVRDLAHGDQILSRAKVLQQKTGRPVDFELTPETRDAVQAWIKDAGLSAGDFLFFSRVCRGRHLTTRQYARIVDGWVSMIAADPSEYGTHSLRRSKATLIYRQTKNLRAVQLLLGHTKLESTLRYLGVEVDDALEIAEHMEI